MLSTRNWFLLRVLLGSCTIPLSNLQAMRERSTRIQRNLQFHLCGFGSLHSPSETLTSSAMILSYVQILNSLVTYEVYVSSIKPNVIAGGPMTSRSSPDLSLRAKPTYITQPTPIATELRVLSQPSDEPRLDLYHNYVYPLSGGKTHSSATWKRESMTMRIFITIRRGSGCSHRLQ